MLGGSRYFITFEMSLKLADTLRRMNVSKKS